MNNIEEIIVEKFVEGKLDEAHFLDLYEYPFLFGIFCKFAINSEYSQAFCWIFLQM